MGQKRTMSVEEAVDEYIHFKIDETKKDLKEFIDEMNKTHGTKFQSEAPAIGTEFFLARLAIDGHNLWLLFSDEIAGRIFKLIFSKYLKVDKPSDKETADKLFGYMDILDELKKTESKHIKTRLLDKFSETFLKAVLGQDIENFYLDGFSKKDIVDPLILGHCSSLLLKYKISWIAIKDTATIE